MRVETGRVVLIRYTAPGGTRCVGSGLLIDERWVLTADHVAEGSEHRVECDRGAAAVAEAVRSGTPEVDLALLRVGEPFTGLVRLGCARVDRSRVDRVSGCVAVGFPRWRKDGDRRRSAQVEGWLPTAEGLESTADSGLRAGWLTLVGDRIPGAPDIPVGTLSETAPSPWGGMSGAVVVAGGLVAGVVRSHNMAAGGQSLTVTPVTAVDQLPGAAREKFCGALGIQDPDLLPMLPDHVVISPVKITELRGQGHLLDFADRVDELAQLHVLLTGKQAAPVVLYGLGGVGKSQLAVEYAHVHRDELMVVWTARADDPSVLAADLAALGVAAGAASAAEADIEVQLTAARGWLASHPRWLVIIDNVDDPAVLPTVHRLVPDDRLGQVIITSRISTWPGRYHRLEVIALETDPAAQLLLRSTADADEQAALSLAGDLGGLPLALQQAASYCEQNGKTLAGYLALFRDTRRQSRLLGAGADGDETVATTWAVSIDQVRQNNPAAAVLLDVLAYLAPDAIPRTLLATTEEGRGNQDREPYAGPPGGELSPQPADENGVTADPLASLHDLDDVGLDEALGMLRRYSLIQLTPEAIAVHRLVQAVIRASHNQEIRNACASAAASLVWRALPKLDHEAWPAYEALLPHTLAAGSHAATAADSRESAVALLSVAGNYQRERGLYAGARKTLQQALVITEQAFADDHKRVVDALDMLVVALLEAGDPSAACPHAERALRIAEHEFGPDHPQTLEPANNLGEVLRQLGKPAEGRPYAEQALRIAEHEFGPDHPQTLDRRPTTSGACCTSWASPPRPAPTPSRRCGSPSTNSAPTTPETLSPANNLGGVLYQLGKPAEARPHFEQALRIAEHEFGPDHPRALLPASNLGNVLWQLGKPAEARPYAEQALRIAEHEFGPDHPQTLLPANNLGGVLYQLGKPAEARPYFEQALRIAEHEFGPDHPQALSPANNLGEVLRQLGKPAEARPHFEQALRIAEHEFGPDHPQTLPPASNLGNVLLHLGKPAEARPYAEQALRIAEHEFGPDHPQTLLPANNLGGVLYQLGKPAEARPYAEQALRIAELTYRPADERVADYLHRLADIVRRTEPGTVSISLLERAITINEANSGPASPETIADLRCLAAAMVETGRFLPLLPLCNESSQLIRRDLASTMRSSCLPLPHWRTRCWRSVTLRVLCPISSGSSR